MRYRGPLEYDKFALNILQYHNHVNDMIIAEVAGPSADITALKTQIDKLFTSVVGKYDPVPAKSLAGPTEVIYNMILDCEEA
jgi:hypothetical protein